MPENMGIPEEKPKRIRKREPKSIIKDIVKELGIDTVNVYPHKLELYQAEVGMELEKDGKLPFLMIFEGDGEGVVNLEVELPNGTVAITKVDILRIVTDTWNNELKSFKIKSRGFSGCIAASAKKILKCNAKKIYMIY